MGCLRTLKASQSIFVCLKVPKNAPNFRKEFWEPVVYDNVEIYILKEFYNFRAFSLNFFSKVTRNNCHKF